MARNNYFSLIYNYLYVRCESGFVKKTKTHGWVNKRHLGPEEEEVEEDVVDDDPLERFRLAEGYSICFHYPIGNLFPNNSRLQVDTVQISQVLKKADV